MAIRCGRCSCYHESVADVRACFNGGHVAVIDVPQQTTRANAPSEKQIAYANKLLEQLGRPARTEAEWIENGQTRRSISELINDLQIDIEHAKRDGTLQARQDSAPHKHLQAADYPDVRAGYYAVPSLTGNNDLDFFRVDKPEEGYWKGCLFVKRILGGHDPERVAHATAEAWLRNLLAVGIGKRGEAVRKAMETFGQNMGRCGSCGRTLTDETSRAYGIGPDCRNKS